MLTGFENQTYELTDYERTTLLPLFLKGFSNKFGKDKAVTNKKMVESLKKKGFEITDTRVRKLINYIRTNHLIPGLIATSNGYFISADAVEVSKYISSLSGRENEIRRVKEGMEAYLKTLKSKSR